jgi:hypothetical protein
MALIKLRDSDLPRDANARALLDHHVYDRDEEKIGTVKDLYLDEEDKDVRFLDVGAGRRGWRLFGVRREALHGPNGSRHRHGGRGDDRAEAREGGGIARARHQGRARGRVPARGLRLLRLPLPAVGQVVGPLGALDEPRRGRVEGWDGRRVGALGYDLYKKAEVLR